MIASIGRRIGRRGLSGVMGGRRFARVPLEQYITAPRLTGTRPPVMASPPTAEVSADWANASTISGADAYRASANPRMFSVSHGNAALGSGFPDGDGVASNSLNVTFGSDTLKYSIIHTGQVIEWVIKGSGQGWRLWVDGEVGTFTGTQNTAIWGEFVLIKVDFGSVATRHIAIETPCRFFGCYVSPGDAVAPAPISGPRIIIVGDSFTEGTGGESGYMVGQVGWAGLFGYHLGSDDVWTSGSGGTGYINTLPESSRGDFASRVDSDVNAWSPDVVVVAGGINDAPYSVPEFRSAVRALYRSIKIANPQAVLVGVSPFWKSGDLPQKIADFGAIIEDEAQRVGGYYIDVHPFWTGTGNAGAPAGDGNSDIYVHPDGTHPTQAGHEALGRHCADLLIAQLLP